LIRVGACGGQLVIRFALRHHFHRINRERLESFFCATTFVQPSHPSPGDHCWAGRRRANRVQHSSDTPQAQPANPVGAEPRSDALCAGAERHSQRAGGNLDQSSAHSRSRPRVPGTHRPRSDARRHHGHQVMSSAKLDNPSLNSQASTASNAFSVGLSRLPSSFTVLGAIPPRRSRHRDGHPCRRSHGR